MDGRRIQRQIRARRRAGRPGANRFTPADDCGDAQTQTHIKCTWRTKTSILNEYLCAPAHVDTAGTRPVSPTYLDFDTGGAFGSAATAVADIAAEQHPQTAHAAQIQAFADGLDAHHIHAAQAQG